MTWWEPRPSGGRGCRLWRRCSQAWTATGTAWSAGTSSWSTAAEITGDVTSTRVIYISRGRIDPEQFHFIILNYCYLRLKLAVWEDQFELIGSWDWNRIIGSTLLCWQGARNKYWTWSWLHPNLQSLPRPRPWIKVCRRAGASKFKYFMFSVFTTASPSCPRRHSGPNKDNVRNLMTQTRDYSSTASVHTFILQ